MIFSLSQRRKERKRERRSIRKKVASMAVNMVTKKKRKEIILLTIPPASAVLVMAVKRVVVYHNSHTICIQSAVNHTSGKIILENSSTFHQNNHLSINIVNSEKVVSRFTKKSFRLPNGEKESKVCQRKANYLNK